MREDELKVRRLRSAFVETTPDDRPTAACPPADAIWDAVGQGLEPGELRRVIGHVASCPACTESWRLASEIVGDEASGTRSRCPPEPHDRRLRRVGWSSALAAMLAMGFFSFFYEGIGPGSIPRAAAGADTALRLAPPEEPPTAECELRWTGLEGATYNVQILTERFELLAEESNLTQPRFRVPEELLASRPADTGLRLYVAAKSGLEGTLADATFDVECAP